MGLWAGAAKHEITPPPGVELMGYGARRGVSTRVHDALFARALWLAPEPASSAGILLVSAELRLMSPARARDIRERLAAKLGSAPERVLVGCTHTHSGPDTGLGAETAGREAPAHVEALVQGVVEAGLQAHAAARRARLGWGRGEARIGRNRRIEGGPLDPEVSVLRVDGEDGRPLCVLYGHGCHGTVLGHDNLEVSADWSGVSSERVEDASGAIALFLLGAHADIDPRTRALMDPAIPGQSVGLGFGAVRVLGEEVAEAVLGVLDPIATSDAVVAATSRTLTLPLHLGEHGPEAAERRLAQRKAELARTLGVEPDALPRLSELVEFAGRGLGERPLEEIRERIARARLYLRD